MTETVSQENSGAQATTVSSGVANRYATALFELGLEEKSLDKIEADLSDFSKMLAGSDDLKRLVKSPVFSADEQLAALGQVFDKAGFSGSAANLIKIAAKNRRLFAVPGMISAFHGMAAAHRGEVSADVVAAQTLDKREKKKGRRKKK